MTTYQWRRDRVRNAFTVLETSLAAAIRDDGAAQESAVECANRAVERALGDLSLFEFSPGEEPLRWNDALIEIAKICVRNLVQAIQDGRIPDPTLDEREAWYRNPISLSPERRMVVGAWCRVNMVDIDAREKHLDDREKLEERIATLYGEQSGEARPHTN